MSYDYDLNGKPVLKCCGNCQHIDDVSDGPEYGAATWVCIEHPNMSNLKRFPFRVELSCFELNSVHLIDWEAEAKICAT